MACAWRARLSGRAGRYFAAQVAGHGQGAGVRRFPISPFNLLPANLLPAPPELNLNSALIFQLFRLSAHSTLSKWLTKATD